MQFSDEFFEDEVRSGFYIPGLMKSAWAMQLQVLEEIDRVCQKYKLTWYAEYGTILGAVRHNGFIPWDDDLDISMKRSDYERFCQVAEKEFPKEYEVLSIHTGSKAYRELLTRVNGRREITTEPTALKKSHRQPYVLGVDIFCLDYVPRDEKKAEHIRAVVTLAKQIEQLLLMPIPDMNRIKEMLSRLQSMTGAGFDYKRDLQRQLDMLIERTFGSVKETEADSIAMMHDWFNSNGSNCFPKEYYSSVVWMPFENTKMAVPLGYNSILKFKYGDYMRLVKSGGGHDYYFQNQQEKFEKVTGTPPYKYAFNPEDLKNPEREGYRNSGQQILAFFDVLLGLHGEIRKLIEKGEYIAAGDMLVQCQQSAISLGEVIDSLGKGDGDTIHCLEEYCEALFNCYERLAAIVNNEEGLEQSATSNDDSSDNNGLLSKEIYSVLNQVLSNSRSIAQKEIAGKREIVFVVYMPKYWSRLAPLYREMLAEPDTDIYIIAPPYYTKQFDGQKIKLYERFEELENKLKLTAYDAYDFKGRHPDMIVIQQPYDGCNFSVSTHPYYYAGNLKKYTEKLVYVPCFGEDDITPSDERAIINMESYVTMPGLMHADEIWLSSEAMKAAYIRKLTEFAGEETRHIWEGKIIVCKSKLQAVSSERDVLDMGDISNTVKKKLLFTNSVSTLLENGEQLITKLRIVLKTFKENREKIELIWHPLPGIYETAKQLRLPCAEQYKSLVEEYISEGWGEYDTDSTVMELAEKCDAYYGDASVLAQELRRNNKPVMIMDATIGT